METCAPALKCFHQHVTQIPPMYIFSPKNMSHNLPKVQRIEKCNFFKYLEERDMLVNSNNIYYKETGLDRLEDPPRSIIPIISCVFLFSKVAKSLSTGIFVKHI